MELQKQVVSLELAKQLKELGVKQDSLFYWVEHYSFAESLVDNKAIRKWSIFYQYDKDDRVNEQVSAFTVAELGEMLPSHIEIDGILHGLEIFRSVNKSLWFVEYTTTADIDDFPVESEHSEADARAKMLIWLIENKYLEDKK